MVHPIAVSALNKNKGNCEVSRGVTILNNLGRGGVFEQRPEGDEGGSHKDIWEKVFLAEATARAKARGQHRAWSVGGTPRRPVCVEREKR